EKPVRVAITALGNWKKYKIAQLHYATNGREGLAAMRELRPDLVFVDMQMPVINGIDFLKQATQEFEEVKYIVVSGYDDFQYAQAAIKNGAIDYLLKPLSSEDLNTAIERAFIQLGGILDEPDGDSAAQQLTPYEVIEIIRDYVKKNYACDISISMFSEKYFFSKEYLSKLFKKQYHIGIYEYALKLRMDRAKELLSDSSIQIQEISDRLGYSNNNYFSKAFKNYCGISPTDYRDSL
ncbi:MAG TPA: response regulator, partial [Lachnospiraceae bacterium]|nr:response regulator [Lachnospiraceae bacterium]